MYIKLILNKVLSNLRKYLVDSFVFNKKPYNWQVCFFKISPIKGMKTFLLKGIYIQGLIFR